MKKHWTWHFESTETDRSLPDRWLVPENRAALTIVKRNPVRTVYRTSDGNFYLKHDTPRSVSGKCRALFFSKNGAEFRTARMLREAGIACCRIPLYGTSGFQSVLFSEALADSVDARRFWYETARARSELRTAFLDTLASFTARLFRARVFHPDFHAGNLLVSQTTGAAALVDLYGIRRKRVLSSHDCALMMRLFLAFAEDLTSGEIERVFRIAFHGSCAAPEDVWKLWDSLLASERALADRQWSRRRRQILSGRSKFCREREENGCRVLIRNNEWYGEREYDREKLRSEELDRAEAEDRFAKSFLRALRKDREGDRAVLLEYGVEGKCRVYYTLGGGNLS